MKETVETLREKGICPTCYQWEHGGIYPDISDKMLYEDDILQCFFETRPRSVGHTIILSKTHYQDMSYLPDDECAAIYIFAKKAMNALKETLGVERVYLCTMCDTPANHFHIQLIPRHPNTPNGSTNFVKPRGEYVENKAHTEELRQRLYGK
jgi:diadenosine tetraphosphate (Ap4A) HIT family hydrolase